MMKLVSLVIHHCYYCIFLPEGQATSLHVIVSVRGIVLVDAQFVSLLAAPVLNNWIQENINLLDN